jgi:hypothetical protein
MDKMTQEVIVCYNFFLFSRFLFFAFSNFLFSLSLSFFLSLFLFVLQIFAHGVSPNDDGLSGQLNKVLGRVSNYTNMLRFGSVHSAPDLENNLQALFGASDMMIDTVKETDVKICAVSALSSVFPPQVWKKVNE